MLLFVYCYHFYEVPIRRILIRGKNYVYCNQCSVCFALLLPWRMCSGSVYATTLFVPELPHVLLFLLGTFVTFLCSIPPPVIAFPVDVLLLIMQFVNPIYIFRNLYLKLNNLNWFRFFSYLFASFVNILIYEYKLVHSTITRTDSVKDLGVYLDTKLYFITTPILFFLTAWSC
jgi:hypothetical protein